MCNRSSPNSTPDEFIQMFNNSADCEFLGIPYSPHADDGHESTLPTETTTPDRLNMAFINEPNDNEQNSQINLSQQESQTTNEASSAIDDFINKIIEMEHEIVDLRRPKTPTMRSIGMMSRTPTMISTGTMPRTPTTTVSSSASINETIDLCSSPATTIDLVSPEIETIDLCSLDTPTNTSSHN